MTRVLITGLSRYWGGRLAQILENAPSVELIVGVDTREPTVELERTEFVRIREDYAPLRRIVEAAEIDTILHTHLIVDSTATSGGRLHEQNVIGTMNLLAAAGATDSPVRKVIVKSSTLVYGSGRGDPQIFLEQSKRSNAPRTGIERSLIEVEDYVRDFAEDNPHVIVTLMRCANVIGTDIETPMMDAIMLPAVPYLSGFDPLVQVVHVDDCASALAFGVEHDLPGIYNVAAEGMIPWSEVRAICAKPGLPLPPFGSAAAAAVLRAARVVDLPPELLDMLRFGRGVDNKALQHAGFRYRYTTVQALRDLLAAMRLKAVVGNSEPAAFYQDDLENFLHRHALDRSS